MRIYTFCTFLISTSFDHSLGNLCSILIPITGQNKDAITNPDQSLRKCYICNEPYKLPCQNNATKDVKECEKGALGCYSQAHKESEEDDPLTQGKEGPSGGTRRGCWYESTNDFYSLKFPEVKNNLITNLTGCYEPNPAKDIGQCEGCIARVCICTDIEPCNGPESDAYLIKGLYNNLPNKTARNYPDNSEDLPGSDEQRKSGSVDGLKARFKICFVTIGIGFFLSGFDK